ncbi:glucan endo-1,3-beta-glucosidase-like [Bidens hawaiensis]|uniref:glucan endo-1,3-beta-glucosidase-like n=1 Tax=Bidens hawaiensis TaxID=980011 RepID=UPI00404B03FC
MAFNLLLLGGLLINIFLLTDAQSVGVCYGQVGDNLPSPQDVVNLYRANGITRMRIYAPNEATLRALRGTNIQLIVDVPNVDLQALNNPNAATNWVRQNITSYPDVSFRYIAVGNEVDPNHETNKQFIKFVLPAMINVQNALNAAGYNRIKVSTATYTGLLKDSYPPSIGAFHANVQDYIGPIITFLNQNGSPMLANIYPYFAHIGPPALPDLPFALFTRTTPAYTDQNRPYSNLFDAMYDAHYAAQLRLGGGNIEIVVSESGWPSAAGPFASIENAGTYYRNLISHVKSTNGTPARRGRSIETYLFAMFDENKKPNAESEQHFGVFSPRQQSKYQLRF